MDKPYYVYMVRCQNDAIYTGIALDVDKRIEKHNSKKGSRSVIAHGIPVELQCMIHQPNKSQALKLEAKIKKFSKKDKELFIDIMNNHFKETHETSDDN